MRSSWPRKQQTVCCLIQEHQKESRLPRRCKYGPIYTAECWACHKNRHNPRHHPKSSASEGLKKNNAKEIVSNKASGITLKWLIYKCGWKCIMLINFNINMILRIFKPYLTINSILKILRKLKNCKKSRWVQNYD